MKRTILATFELEVPDDVRPPYASEVAQYLAISCMDVGTEQDPPWKLTHPIVFMDKATMVANISGGVLQGASSEIPLDIIALDFEADDAKFPVPDPSGGEAEVSECSALVDPEWVRDVRDAWINADEEDEDDETT